MNLLKNVNTVGTVNVGKVVNCNTNIEEIENKLPNHDKYITT